MRHVVAIGAKGGGRVVVGCQYGDEWAESVVLLAEGNGETAVRLSPAQACRVARALASRAQVVERFG